MLIASDDDDDDDGRNERVVGFLFLFIHTTAEEANAARTAMDGRTATAAARI